MSLPTLLHSKRNVVALNNMGVSLIERSAHSEAVAALKGSVSLMKQVYRDLHGQGGSENDSSRNEMMKDSLQRCSEALASVVCSRVSTDEIHAASTADPSLANFLSLRESSSTLLVPVKIECSVEDIDNETLSSITLYNFGIAELVSSGTTSGPCMMRKLDVVDKIFALVLRILKNISEGVDVDPLVLFLASMSSSYSSQILRAQHRHTDAAQAESQATELRQILLEFCKEHPWFKETVAAAAA